MLPHVPALRRGKPYPSLDQSEVKDSRTGEVLVRLSQVNAGIIRKDLSRAGESRAALRKLSCEDLLKICEKTAELFQKAPCPGGEVEIGPLDDDFCCGLARLIEKIFRIVLIQRARAATARNEDIGFHLMEMVAENVVHLIAREPLFDELASPFAPTQCLLSVSRLLALRLDVE